MCNRYISMTGEEGIEKDPKEKTLTAGLRGAFQVLGTALAKARRKEAPCCGERMQCGLGDIKWEAGHWRRRWGPRWDCLPGLHFHDEFQEGYLLPFQLVKPFNSN